MLHIFRLTLIVAGSSLFGTLAVAAEFVDPQRDLRVDIPDHWIRLDQSVVDELNGVGAPPEPGPRADAFAAFAVGDGVDAPMAEFWSVALRMSRTTAYEIKAQFAGPQGRSRMRAQLMALDEIAKVGDIAMSWHEDPGHIELVADCFDHQGEAFSGISFIKLSGNGVLFVRSQIYLEERDAMLEELRPLMASMDFGANNSWLPEPSGEKKSLGLQAANMFGYVLGSGFSLLLFCVLGRWRAGFRKKR